MSIRELISNEIENIKLKGFYRQLNENKNNNAIINLSSNDYLGLASNAEIKRAVKQIISIYPLSSASSPLMYGYFKPHIDLENKLCSFKGGYERCILYPSGYQANIGVISALSGISLNKTFIAFDELSHASIVDGVLCSKAKFRRFEHNNPEHLDKILKKYSSYEIKIVITEGVFSMDGDIANLPDIMKAAKDNNALIILDDAHATGTIGSFGGGSCNFYSDGGLKLKPDIMVGTLGKALASEGAFVLSDNLMIDYLINKSRPYIFSTAISPVAAGIALQALNIIENNPKLVIKLQMMSQNVRNVLKNCGLNILNSNTHIIPILIGDEIKAAKIEKTFINEGILLKSVKYPTVAKGSARLRLSVNAGLSEAEVKFVLEKLIELIK
jgi:8-amino-7-oxononanoate synthase